MIDDLGSLVGDWIGDSIGADWGARAWEKGRIRRAAKAFEAGRAVIFPGWVLGEKPYCRPAGGMLELTPDALYHVVDRGMPITRRNVPVERLAITAVRAPAWDDYTGVPSRWALLQATDGAEPVTIACHEAEMRYVRHAFARTRLTCT